MRRLISLAASVALLAMLAMPTLARPTTNTIYLALGDSLAVGEGASVPAHTGYVGRLDGYFHGRSHGGADSLVTFAKGGETTGSFITDQLPKALDAINDPDTQVAVVTLSIGGDDLLPLLAPGGPCVPDPSVPACTTAVGAALHNAAGNMAYIMGALATALYLDGGGAKIFVLTLWNPFGGTGSPFETAIDFALLGSDGVIDCANPSGWGLNDIVGCIAGSAGAVVVGTYDLFDGNAAMLSNIGEGEFNFHPNDEGYALIAWAHRVADRAS